MTQSTEKWTPEERKVAARQIRDTLGLWSLTEIAIDLACQRNLLLQSLEWALPLALMQMEQHRLNRLQRGHSDIGEGRERNKTETLIGLWDSEVEQMDRAIAAIAKTK